MMRLRIANLLLHFTGFLLLVSCVFEATIVTSRAHDYRELSWMILSAALVFVCGVGFLLPQLAAKRVSSLALGGTAVRLFCEHAYRLQNWWIYCFFFAPLLASFFASGRRLNLTAGKVLFASGLAVAALATGSLRAQYKPPTSDAITLHGVDFARAQQVGPDLTQLYRTCDLQETRGGCASDPARNTVLLKFPDSNASDGTPLAPGPVFFDAKMAIDADGSTISKLAERPNQPETALRYPTNGESLDSEQVPYIVMPLGNFRQATGVGLGDLAAVVKDGQVHFAIVGDLGPRTHLGEGSMALHSLFGHLRCETRDADGHCMRFVDVSIDPPVLYFVFPDSRKLLGEALGPENINGRINALGAQLWNAFLIEQRSSTHGPVGKKD